jgi:hypothetical protein
MIPKVVIRPCSILMQKGEYWLGSIARILDGIVVFQETQ